MSRQMQQLIVIVVVLYILSVAVLHQKSPAHLKKTDSPVPIVAAIPEIQSSLRSFAKQTTPLVSAASVKLHDLAHPLPYPGLAFHTQNGSALITKTRAASFQNRLPEEPPPALLIPHLKVEAQEETPAVAETPTPPLSIDQHRHPPRGVIAYAVTITRDGPYVDGAAVLGQGVRAAHTGEGLAQGGKGGATAKKPPRSAYDFALVAIVHPSVVKARAPLERLGWRVLERDLPFKLEEIKNQAYAKAVVTNGCCGHLELLKLWAWSLTEYAWVVHLDMDSFVMAPMDELFDTSLHANDNSSSSSSSSSVGGVGGGGGGVSVFFTRDYNMSPGRPITSAPVQGGFLAVRPDMHHFHALWAIVKEGDFGKGKGWGGSGIGNFWGGMTIQGLVPYYVVKVAPASYSREVDRCVYNQMVDAAGDPTSKSAALAGMQVPNCRHTAFEDTKNVHFTLCQKPWSCVRGSRQPLCMGFHKAWMQRRRDLELHLGLPPSVACKKGLSGEDAYVPLQLAP